MMKNQMNPFNVSYGKRPVNEISRYSDYSQIVEDYEDLNPSTNTYIITGVRGSGKTVLYNSIINHFQEDDNWIVVRLNPELNLLEELASKIYETGRLKSLFIKKEFSFSFKGFSFSIEGEKPVTSVDTLISKMLDYLRKKDKRVLVGIDEITSNKETKAFFHSFQMYISDNFQIYLLMTGLYENVSILENDKTLTFLYRASKINLESLSLNLISKSYQSIFNTNEEKAIELAKLTKGYAFAYQLLGRILWNKYSLEITDDVLEEYDQRLSDMSYEKIYIDLPENEKKALLSFISDDKLIKSNELSVYRKRLSKRGIISSTNSKDIKFLLPRFEIYLKNIIKYEI